MIGFLTKPYPHPFYFSNAYLNVDVLAAKFSLLYSLKMNSDSKINLKYIYKYKLKMTANLTHNAIKGSHCA